MYIETEKLILRAIEKKDNQMLFDLINDPETEYMLGGWSFPTSTDDQEQWFKNIKNEKNTLRLIIDKKDNNLSIGTIILTNIDYKNGNAEIHIKLAKGNVRGHGYGTESVRALTKYCFSELRMNSIYAYINSYNEISCRMFEKCGYKRDGELRGRIYKNGKLSNVYAYSILQSEFKC